MMSIYLEIMDGMSEYKCSAARRSRNKRRATAILAVLGLGRDARGTRRRRKRKFLVKKTRIYDTAMRTCFVGPRLFHREGVLAARPQPPGVTVTTPALSAPPLLNQEGSF
jgi:hypothetical protein